MADDGFPSLMTLREAADFLGVPIEAVALWAREGRLLAAARNETGELLFYRWRVERDGWKLAMEEPVRLAPRRGKWIGFLIDPRTLPCGCCFAGATGEAARQSVWLCPDARSLQSAAGLTAAFAAVAPHDPFFRHLRNVTREALARHLGDPAGSGGGDEADPAAPIGCATIVL